MDFKKQFSKDFDVSHPLNIQTNFSNSQITFSANEPLNTAILGVDEICALPPFKQANYGLITRNMQSILLNDQPTDLPVLWHYTTYRLAPLMVLYFPLSRLGNGATPMKLQRKGKACQAICPMDFRDTLVRHQHMKP